MKINQIFKNLIGADLDDPRHLYEDFKREQKAIQEATPKFKIPRAKSEANKKYKSQNEVPLNKDTAGSIDIKPSPKAMPKFVMPEINPAAKRMGGKVTGAAKGAGLSQETMAKRDDEARSYKGEFSGKMQKPVRMSAIPKAKEYDTVSDDEAQKIQQDAVKAAAKKEADRAAREAHREAGGVYHASGTGEGEGKEIKGDDYLSSASKKYSGRETADGYKVLVKDPGQEELEDIESEEGLTDEMKTRVATTGGEYIDKFQKQRTAHAKERGVPLITSNSSPENKEQVNQLAMDAQQGGTEEIPASGKQTTARRKDSQAVTDLYDASVNFLVTTSRRVLSKAGLTGGRALSMLDDAFQEATAQWYDAVSKYKSEDGDFENFMRAHVSRGIKNWAQTELQGAAPQGRWSADQLTKLNKIKAALQQEGVPEEELLTAAVDRWNEEEDANVAKAAEEGRTITPKYTDAQKLRRIETSRGFWGSSDEEIEGEEGAIGTVGSLAPGGDPGEIYGEFGSAQAGTIGSGASTEDDIENIEREGQLGGSKKGLQKLKNMMIDANIPENEREIFGMLWGFGGVKPKTEADVGRELELTGRQVKALKNSATAKVIKYMTDVIGWDEAEIRDYLQDVFEERTQLFNLTSQPAFEPSTKKVGADVISRDRKRAIQQLDSMRNKRAEKYGAERSAARKQRQADLMPSGEFTASDEPSIRGSEEDIVRGKMDPMKGGRIGAENYKILKKRYAGVEKALGRLGDDATEADVEAWYNKANKYLSSTYGLEAPEGAEYQGAKQTDFTSQEFLDKVAAAKEAKLLELYKSRGRGDLSFEDYKKRLVAAGTIQPQPTRQKVPPFAKNEKGKVQDEEPKEFSPRKTEISPQKQHQLDREKAMWQRQSDRLRREGKLKPSKK